MDRHRVVLDTNVLISALLFGGKPQEVLELVIAHRISMFLCPAILEELRDVLCRPKFGFSAEACLQVIEELHSICEIVLPQQRITRISSDPADNRVIECAIEADAQYIITGDSHLLGIGKFRGTCILTPAEYLDQVFRR
ncbi:MAG TPA: putative toxin-antitoxin system toxin component, PIN family [Thermodesulfobacteriota bacterium]|nr:putative toxin-antitoxin system toxin component, PIN family [Deltaproteobacteria bacterium]HNR13823.1 putative toxin-antitoxin system toxin component, PIN family [Thermodesulfobacteriota bacterium]HNU71516.1 putative toxin-antitoxin system toxin component, PIN family [Thermodesulfobacteriota bacterium]